MMKIKFSSIMHKRFPCSTLVTKDVDIYVKHLYELTFAYCNAKMASFNNENWMNTLWVSDILISHPYFVDPNEALCL